VCCPGKYPDLEDTVVEKPHRRFPGDFHELLYNPNFTMGSVNDCPSQDTNHPERVVVQEQQIPRTIFTRHIIVPIVFLFPSVWTCGIWIFSSAFKQPEPAANLHIFVADLDGGHIGEVPFASLLGFTSSLLLTRILTFRRTVYVCGMLVDPRDLLYCYFWYDRRFLY
jgi:hypothetical protein